MKTNKKIAGAAGSIVFLTLTLTLIAHAQAPSGGGGGGGGPTQQLNPLPIENIAVLKAFALSQAVQAELSIWGPTIVPNGQVTVGFGTKYTETPGFPQLVSGVDVRHLLEQVDRYVPDFRVTQGRDPIHVSLNLRNRDGDVLFSTTPVEARLTPNNAAIPASFLFSAALELKLSSTIRLPYKNVRSARVVVRAENGRVLAEKNLPVGNGYITYPVNLVGRYGELIVTSGDGNSPDEIRIYELHEGVSLGTFNTSGHISAGIEGFYEFKDAMSIGPFIRNPKGAVVYAEYTEPKEGVMIVHTIANQWPVRPIAVLIREVGSPPTAPWELVGIPREGTFRINFARAGRLILVYVMPDDNLDNVPITFPSEEKG
jgi:hypothetical protein